MTNPNGGKMINRRSMLTLLVAILMILALMVFMACDPPPTNEEEEEEVATPTDTLLITNGTFENASSSSGTATYIKNTVTGWTANNAASYYSDAKMGVIDVSPDVFSEKRDIITEIEINGPGISPRTPKGEDDAYTDTNALLIGLETAGTVYYKNSSAVTIEQGKYYKLEIDIFTQLLEKSDDLQGAYIVVNSGMYVLFAAIDASDAWKTYTIYIEANNFENRTFYVELWLGYGPKYIGTQTDADLNPRLTKGYIFFDNIILTDITEENGASVYKTASERLGGEGVYESEAVTSLYFPDETFTYYKAYTYSSYTSNSKYYYGVKPGMHNNYSVIVGTSDSTTSSSFPTYDGATTTSGLVDMSKLYTRVNTGTDEAPSYEFTDSLKALTTTFRAPDWKDFFNTDGIFGLYSIASDDTVGRDATTLKDTTALMIYHPDFSISGAGMKSSQQFLIEKSKYYDISVYAYVWVPKFDNAMPEKDSNYTYDEPQKDSNFVYEEPQRDNFAEGAAGDTEYENAMTFYNSEENQQKITEYENAMTSYNSTTNQQKITDYNDKMKAWQKAKDDYNEAIREGSYTAEFRLTGTSIESGSLIKTTVALNYIEDTTDGNLYVPGGWQKLTFKIRGNELSDRKVNFEFWYGEGEWESEGLMVGGVIFDDISIIIGENPLDNDSSAYDVIAPIDLTETEEFNMIGNDSEGGIFDNNSYIDYTEEGSSPWQFDFVDNRSSEASALAGLIYGKTAADEELWEAFARDTLNSPELKKPYGASPIQVTLEDGKDPSVFDLLMLYNKEYTATSLVYNSITKASVDGEDDVRNYKTILKNNFYRISMWIRTDAIAAGFGLTISIYDDTDTSQATLTSLNTNGEWTEVAFLIRGSTTDDTQYYLKYELGSGDIFTPATHVKGVAYITAIIISKITYTEYNSAVTDTYSTKKQISNLPSTTDSITNGYFADLSTTNYETKDGDELIFDENGVLVGSASPNSWTLSSATNAITAPSNLTISTASGDDEEFGLSEGDQYLTWKYLVGGKTGTSLDPKENLVYLIYIDGASWPDPDNPDADPVKKDNVLIGRVAQPVSGSAPKFKIEIYSVGSFKVRAAYLPETLPDYDSGIITGISAYSTTLKNSAEAPEEEGEENSASNVVDLTDQYHIKDAKFGVIDYKTYSDAAILGLEENDDRKIFYTGADADSGLKYISGYADTLLMLHSDYYTRGGYTASSTSLSADSYYMLAVWVKTNEGATASITINNTSKIFADTDSLGVSTDGDYIGFINIDTKGEWVQYRFYMQTLVTPASFQLELFLGNKYAESFVPKDEEGNDSTLTVIQGLTRGTVFFDDILFKTLTKEEYELYLYGKTEDSTEDSNSGTDDSDEPEDSDSESDDSEDDNKLKPYTLYSLSDLDDVYSCFTNMYMFRLLDYTTDSFDLYTAESSSSPSQGGTPKDYTHYVASTGTDYDSSVEDDGELAMIYGVYDKRKINAESDIIRSIMASNSETGEKKEIWLGDATQQDLVNFLTSNTGNGNHYLLMGNLIVNGQYYLSQTSISLAAESYYKITFTAKTWFQDENSYAEFRFEYGNDTTKWSTIRIPGSYGREVVTEYTFYVYNADPTNAVSGNNISFHLGTNSSASTSSVADNFFRGLLIIDDVTVAQLETSDEYDEYSEKYENLTEEDKYTKPYATYKFAASSPADDEVDNNDGDGDENTNKINPEVWFLISSIVIGAILIVVIVVIIWRRIKKKIDRARPVKVISSIQVNAPSVDESPLISDKEEIDDSEFSDDFDIAQKPVAPKITIDPSVVKKASPDNPKQGTPKFKPRPQKKNRKK
ncbi:MAG: hypothetical protein LBF12_02975 [Christensenellaceae bacterium]|jgi:hypothetical protein|nr:hypothetical protein [Christensenellaceae bacterium]